MPLPVALNTNEVKDSAGAEVEFARQSTEGRKLVFARVGEFALRHRLTVSHSETGSGSSLRRRSLVRVDKDVTGTSGETRTISAYIVLDVPVGDLGNDTETKNTVANLLSFSATTGAATTVLLDCTGNGASALVSGSL